MENTESSILDQGPMQSFQSVAPNKKGGAKKLWILILLIVVAIAAFLFLRPSDTSTKKPEPTVEPTTIIEEPTITEEAETTPTVEPTKAVKKTSTGPSIQVQNGSGEEGVAGKMQTALTDSGYDNSETANADNFDYKGVTIKAKDASMAVAKKLKTQLTGYTFADEIATLSDDSDFDIVIIVGK